MKWGRKSVFILGYPKLLMIKQNTSSIWEALINVACVNKRATHSHNVG